MLALFIPLTVRSRISATFHRLSIVLDMLFPQVTRLAPPETFRLVSAGPAHVLPIPYELVPMIAVTVDPHTGKETREPVVEYRAQIFERRTSQSDVHVDWLAIAEPIGADGAVIPYNHIALADGSTDSFDSLSNDDLDELTHQVEMGCLFVDLVSDALERQEDDAA